MIVVDEIDQLDSKNETVLYSLFELPKLEKSRAIFFGMFLRGLFPLSGSQLM